MGGGGDHLVWLRIQKTLTSNGGFPIIKLVLLLQLWSIFGIHRLPMLWAWVLQSIISSAKPRMLLDSLRSLEQWCSCADGWSTSGGKLKLIINMHRWDYIIVPILCLFCSGIGSKSSLLSHLCIHSVLSSRAFPGCRGAVIAYRPIVMLLQSIWR